MTAEEKLKWYGALLARPGEAVPQPTKVLKCSYKTSQPRILKLQGHHVHPWWTRAAIETMMDNWTKPFPREDQKQRKVPVLERHTPIWTLTKAVHSLQCRQRLSEHVMHIKNVPRCELLDGKPREFACEEVRLARSWVYVWLEHSLWDLEPGRSKLTSPQLKEALTLRETEMNSGMGAACGLSRSVQALRMETVVQSPAVSRCLSRLSALNFGPNLKHGVICLGFSQAMWHQSRRGMLIWMALICKIEETDWQMQHSGVHRLR